MSEDIARLISIIKDSQVRDRPYYAAETELLRLAQVALPFLSELADCHDCIAAARAKEIMARIIEMDKDNRN